MTIIVLFCLSGMLAAGGRSGDERHYIGVSMPTKSSPRWIYEGNNIQSSLEEMNFKVDLQFAEDIVENQVSQLENMITKGVELLIIAPIDGESLTNVLAKAHEEGIRVISYDRLLRNSEYVDYYVTFDNFIVGVQQANSLVDALQLQTAAGPFNIEIFGGSPDDNNAYLFYDGAMSILQPYIDSGRLVVQSNQLEMSKVAILRWDGATAQARMDNLLSAFYSINRVNAVLSPYDGLSMGIISSLKGVGYGSGDLPMPYVSGQDAELPSLKAIINGEQYSTIFKDTRKLAAQAIKMAVSLLEGAEVAINDSKTYDNGVKVVPSFLLPSVTVTKANLKEALVDSGYYSSEQLFN